MRRLRRQYPHLPTSQPGKRPVLTTTLLTCLMLQATIPPTPFIMAHGGTAKSAFDALLAGMNAGTAYANIHTSVHPGGEIRGFLAPIPEPETYAMFLAGLALMGAVARRRRG